MKFICISIALLLLPLVVSTGLSQKKLHPKITKEQAVKVVREKFPEATIEGSELEEEEGKTIWSFDLKVSGETKEVWVDAKTGKIIKTEVESAAREKDEKVADKAEKAALKKVPGEITKTAVKDEKGNKVYSFEIKTKKGKTVEVDVNAKTNKVVKVESEESEKGEKDEKED